MIVIQDVLVSDEIVNEEFICNLNACKGACCWEGDFGAPVTEKEMEIISDLYPHIVAELSEESVQHLIERGGFARYKDDDESFLGTNLLPNGACVYMTTDTNGYAKCGIEKAYEKGTIDFRKPASCHLYPIRVTKNEKAGFEAWNYDKWDICSAGCTLGKKEKVPLYQFLKNAIIQQKGEAFYEELDAAAEHIKTQI